MLDKVGQMKEWFETLQRLMKDEKFRAFLSNPKVQELMKDPEFQEILKTQDKSRLATHPKFLALAQDPQLASLIAQIGLQGFSRE